MTRLGLGAQHRLCSLYDGNTFETKSFAGKTKILLCLKTVCRTSGGTTFTLHSDVKHSYLPGGSHAHVNACKEVLPLPPALRTEPAVPSHLHCKVTSRTHCVASALPTSPDQGVMA